MGLGRHVAGFRRYDTCFLKWYSESMLPSRSTLTNPRLTNILEYLRGVGSLENNECSELFKQYTRCLQVS